MIPCDSTASNKIRTEGKSSKRPTLCTCFYSFDNATPVTFCSDQWYQWSCASSGNVLKRERSERHFIF